MLRVGGEEGAGKDSKRASGKAYCMLLHAALTRRKSHPGHPDGIDISDSIVQDLPFTAEVPSLSASIIATRS